MEKRAPVAGLRYHTSPQAEQNGFTDWLLNCPKLYSSYLKLMATDPFFFKVLSLLWSEIYGIKR